MLSGLLRLYERGYSLTPVVISRSDYNPTEGLGTEVMNRTEAFCSVPVMAADLVVYT